MSITKIGVCDEIGASNIVPLKDIEADTKVLKQFRDVIASLKTAQLTATGKKIAPRMDDFLYSYCIQMHAAEASLIDQDTGEFKKNARGEPVKGWFENITNEKGIPSVRWVSPDGIQAYRNQNRDIFPEEDLIKAHKKWIGKPLCKDHQSSSVDGIRGIIIDTFYDPKFKRVHALFALDRKNYPDLARKVEAGYATNVSMGTAVGRSICTDCANVAATEAEYCPHIRSHSNYGEINKDLTPIELSLVVTGADPGAKVRAVLASFNNYFEKRAEAMDIIEDTMDQKNDFNVEDEITSMETMLKGDRHAEEYMERLRAATHNFRDLHKTQLVRIMGLAKYLGLTRFYEEASNLRAEMDGLKGVKQDRDRVSDITDSSGYGLENDYKDDISTGEMLPEKTQIEPQQAFGSTSGQKEVVKRSNAAHLYDNTKEIPMNFEDLKKRAELRLKQAYMQGTEEPKKYPPMGDSDKIRLKDDKQMSGDELDTSGDISKEELKKKELLQRAELEQRRLRRTALLEQFKKSANTPDVLTKKDSTGKEVLIKKNPDGTMEELKAEDGVQEKKAYWQGTELPRPGQKQYAPMGDSDKIRLKDDKHMSGQGMESGTDGLHPGYGESDESVKKHWQRMASLKARLYKGASAEKAFWEFYADDNKVMTVRASEAYGDELNDVVDGSGQLVNSTEDLPAADFFQTTAYAEEVMKLIRRAGLEKAANQLGAEAPPMPPPAAEVASMGEDAAHADGDPGDKVSEALNSIETALEDIRKATGAEDLKDVDVPADAPVDAAPPLPSPAASREELLTAYSALVDAVEEITMLNDAANQGTENAQDLLTEALADASQVVKQASSILSIAAKKKTDKKVVDKKKEKELADKAKEKAKTMDLKKKEKEKADKEKEKKDAKNAKDSKDTKDGKKKSSAELFNDLLKVRAARREALVAQANDMGLLTEEGSRPWPETETEDDGLATDIQPDTNIDTSPHFSDKEAMTPEQIDALLEELSQMSADDGMYADDKSDLMAHDLEVEEDCGDGTMMTKDHKSKKAKDDEDKVSKEEKEEMEDTAEKEVEKHEKDKKMHGKDKGDDKDDEKSKKEARRAWRDALVAQAKGGTVEGIPLNSDYVGQRSGGGTTSQFDIRPSGDLGKVETLTEVHDAMLGVARQTGPRNVRDAAEKLNTLIIKGAINASMLNDLVAEGAVDSETASYWKQFWGQADGGKEFAAGLTKDFKQSKASLSAAAETEQQVAKLHRAYGTAQDAQDRGMIPLGRTALHAYVDQLVKLPDVAFESIKNIIAQHKKPEGKVVVASPRSGLNYDNSGDTDTPVVQNRSAPSFEDLANIFRK